MRSQRNSFLRKNDLIYQSQLGISDGLEGGLQASAGDRSLSSQVLSAIKDIQASEDNLRRSILEQQNKVLLLDATNKLSDINQNAFQMFAVDPESFKKETTTQSKEVFEKLPFQLREIARRNFLQQQSGYYYKALNNQREYLDKQTFEQTQISIQNLAKDASSSILGLFNSNQAANIQSQISLGVSIAEANQALNAKNSYGVDLFSPLQKQKLSQGFYGTLFEGFAKPKFGSLDSIEEKQKFINEITNGSAKIVYKDPTTNGDIEISSNLLEQGERNAIAKGLFEQLKNEIKKQKEFEQEQQIKQVVSGSSFPDPKDKNYRSSVNTYYEKYVKPNISFEAPLESLNLLGDFINKTKTIPEKLESDIRAYLSSDNFMAFSFASDLVKNISVNNKNLIDYIPEKDIAKALAMNRMTSAGMSPEEAFVSITKNFASVSDNIREQRIRSFNKTLNNEQVKADFDASIMTSGWFFWKENKKPLDFVSDEFYYQFTDLSREFYAMGADFDTARESALALMKKRWGNSVVNGDNILTALPPEKYYEDYALTGDIMRTLLIDYAKDKLPENIDDNKIIVLADKETYATAGNPTSKPSYALCYINDMGVPEPVLGEDLSIVRIGENVWNKESRYKYEKKKFGEKKPKKEICLTDLFKGEEI